MTCYLLSFNYYIPLRELCYFAILRFRMTCYLLSFNYYIPLRKLCCFAILRFNGSIGCYSFGTATIGSMVTRTDWPVMGNSMVVPAAVTAEVEIFLLVSALTMVTLWRLPEAKL